MPTARPRVVTFGEVMLRLSPPGRQRFAQAVLLDMTFAGAEANVAVSLARFGLGAAYVTRLPHNEVADACVAQLRGHGVDTRHVLRGGDRIGVLYLEHGAGQRPSTVTYDRAGSALATIDPAALDWPAILGGAAWLHLTGITPLLGDNCAAACLDAARAARAAGVTVSCDLNFRRSLWGGDRTRDALIGLMSSVDVCIADPEAAETMLGVAPDPPPADASREAFCIASCATLTRQFGFRAVAMTLRDAPTASRTGWAALLHTGGRSHVSRRYEIDAVVDRIGTGDAFAAGLIYATLDGRDPQATVEFAAAAGCLKHTVAGDFNLVTVDEVDALASGAAAPPGRVRR